MRMSYAWAGVVLACALSACALVGCTPGGGDPSPVVSAEITPSVVEAVTPTPQWTPAEQAAVDAVQAYIKQWTYISQNLQNTDPNEIYQIATANLGKNALLEWSLWLQNDWHLVGSPEFTTIYVQSGATDGQGTRYHVYGCYSSENSYLVDSSGTQLEKTQQRGAVSYLTLTTPDNQTFVDEENLQDESC